MLSRRQFLTQLTAVAAAAAYRPPLMFADTAGTAGATVFVVHGTDLAKMLQAGIGRLGGWETFVKRGRPAVLKPNAAWASRPEEGGNTHPQLVELCVRACLQAGAAEVIVPEKPCSPAKDAFGLSGIGEAVARAGGRMYAAERPEHFRMVDLPRAVKLKEAEVVKDILDAPCLINMPVAKSHSGAKLTLSMKNWMGAVQDRRAWHREGLHQCIADFSTLVRPHLVIIDATRIMLTGGPRGPGKLAHPQQLIFSCDPVAADAYAATLFDLKPFDVSHIKIAHAMGIGCGALDEIKIEHIQI